MGSASLYIFRRLIKKKQATCHGKKKVFKFFISTNAMPVFLKREK